MTQQAGNADVTTAAKSDESGKVLEPARLYHVAVCVNSVEETANYYTEKFGIGPFEFREAKFPTATFHGEPGGYRGKRAYARLGPVMLELMEHVEGKTIHTAFMSEKGEGLHHLGFEVDSLQDSVAEAERRGLSVTQGFTRDDGGGFAYFDSDKVGGVVFEVVEKPRTK